MKLYYAPGACSLAPHIALAESGIDFEIEKVDLGAKTTASGKDFLAINPKGAVPTLQRDDGSILTENAVLLQYIAASAPQAALAPAHGTDAHWRLVERLNYIATEIHKGFGPLWKPTTPDAYKAVVKENLAKQFKYLDAELSGRDFVSGDTFSIADAYLFTVLNWTNFHQIDLSPYPALVAFMGRIAARPGVRKALLAEGLIAA